MSREEIDFLQKLSSLTDEDLINWVRGHYTGISYKPLSPFRSISDSMDVLERTIALLQSPYQDTSYYPLIVRFENTLAYVFDEETQNSSIHPGILYKYLFIFINYPPHGAARIRLSKCLMQIIKKRSWINTKYAARNIHYDAVDLVIRLYKNWDGPLFDSSSIEEFLINNIPIEKTARFSNIALDYFRDTHNPEKFFGAFDLSFKILPEKIDTLADSLLLFYIQDTSLSFEYFAEWLSGYQLDKKYRKTLESVYSNEKLLNLILERFENNLEIYCNVNRKEGRYLIALIVIFTSQDIADRLSPFFVKLLFENEEYDYTQKHLYNLRKDLIEKGTDEEIKRLLISFPEERPVYLKVHLASLISVIKSTAGNLDDFSNSNEGNGCIIYPDGFPLESLFIRNTNDGVLRQTYKIKEALKNKREILPGKFPATFQWWQILDQMISKKTSTL